MLNISAFLSTAKWQKFKVDTWFFQVIEIGRLAIALTTVLIFHHYFFHHAGRVLPTPKLVYGDKESTSIMPRDGVWNMRNMKFIEAKSMNAYGILNITRCQDRDIETFVMALTRAGREMGKFF